MSEKIHTKASSIKTEAADADAEIMHAEQTTIQPPTEEPERQYYFIEKCSELVSASAALKGRSLTYCVNTFGCQMNARDSEKIIGILEQIGFVAGEDERADFVLYNTCTVRENANNKVYGHLGQIMPYVKENPEMMVAICGCMMQEAEPVERIKRTYPFVNLIFGTHNIYKFAELLYLAMEARIQFQNPSAHGKYPAMIIDIWEDTDKIVEDLPNKRKYPFKSGVNIMFGCNNFCSYCIVPYVRGRERSREPKDILREVERMAADGVCEVMLLGQNVNSYGKNLEHPMSFAELLREVDKVEGIERIRFMTSHPKDLSDELIDAMRDCGKVCHHLHLPLQSGSDRILKIMNRHYDKESYLSIVEKLRREIPDIAITTDIIVGFPGETEEDFQETMDVVRKARYDSAFTFIYSKRTGTPAAVMEDQVLADVVKNRFNRLLALVQEIAAERSKLLEGKTLPVLAEDVNAQDSNLLTGRLENNSVVHFAADLSRIGTICQVHLTECKGFYYLGELEE